MVDVKQLLSEAEAKYNLEGLTFRVYDHEYNDELTIVELSSGSDRVLKRIPTSEYEDCCVPRYIDILAYALAPIVTAENNDLD